MIAKINYHLAFLLHKYPYQKSWIATLWLRELGLIQAIIPKRTVQYNGQPFSLLQVYGRLSTTGGLAQFYKLEQLAMCYIPTSLLYSCLELNKVIYDHLKFTSAPALFDAYHEFLIHIQAEQLEQRLYKLKMQLLDTLGYGIQNHVDAANQPILAQAYYQIKPFASFQRHETGLAGTTIQNMRCYDQLSVAEITILHAIVNSFLAYSYKNYSP